MDDILESKEVVEYDEIFKEYREGALVLIEGRPGSGKTTLVHKVTRDWGTGRKVLQGARMVFLITLRFLNYSGRDKSLLDILEVFFGGEVLRKNIEKDLWECGGKGACFIIDGLDEYQCKNEMGSVVYQLIYGKCLPFSMVIVASRPVATNKLKKSCSKRVEVIGFTKQQIINYLESYPFNKSVIDISDTVCKLKVYLDRHPNVLHMCYLPVHAAMICFLFSQLEGNIPHTETQIYEQFTISMLLQQRRCDEEQHQLKSLNDLCGEDKVQFSSICKLAFDMIINSQQVVSQSDTQVSLTSTFSPVFNMLTVERTTKQYGVEDLYSFHHLTFQEYLAAFHIAELEEVEQENCISKYHLDYGLKNVWKFVFGLMEVKISKMQQVLKFRSNLYKIKCAFESQQVDVCDYVLGNGILVLENKVITPSDFVALGYVISAASQRISMLIFHSCKWEGDGPLAFCSMITIDKLKFITFLKCKVNNCSDDDFKALNGLLYQLPYLEKLDLLGTKLNHSGIDYLTSNITLQNLKVLKITLPLAFYSQPKVLKLLTFGSHNVKQVYFNSQGLNYHSNSKYVLWNKMLYNAFDFGVLLDCDISWVHLYNSDEFSSFHQEKFSYCSEVALVNCGIDDKGTEILASRLNTSVLEKLVLDFNRISDSGAVALTGCIARCSVVQEVSIQCNSIGDSGAIALADALVHCSSLKRLDLQGNALGDEGAVAISKATEGLPNLNLYCHNVNITEEGVERVLEHRASTKK